MMKSKYFRLLFWGMGSRLMHLGEMKDASTDEKFTFLYVGRGNGNEDGKPRCTAISGDVLFLCPKSVDLLVAGSADEQTDDVLAELLRSSEVKQLVLPKSDYPWKTDLAGAGRVIFLESGCEEAMPGEGLCDSAERKTVGWKFMMKSYTRGSVAVAYWPENREAENGRPFFEDCVMNVKVMDGDRKCQTSESPDGYACALGCALRKDYDVCKYRAAEKDGGWVTGTLLCGEEDCWESVRKDLGDRLEEIRFFHVPGSARVGELARSYKRYYISHVCGPDAGEASGICRSGMYQIPVLVGDGEGICCSGMLKYAEK